MGWLLGLVFLAAGLGVWVWSARKEHRDGPVFWPGCLRTVAAEIISTLLIGVGVLLLIGSIIFYRS